MKYDSRQFGQLIIGMPSITSMDLPRPKLRVTSRRRTPGRPHDAQRLVNAAFDFASRLVALARNDRAGEDDVFEIDAREVVMVKFFGSVDRQSITQ